MEGAHQAAIRAQDRRTIQAYQTATFALAGYRGKLKALDRYLITKRQRPAFDARDALAGFEALAAKGKATVRQIN